MKNTLVAVSIIAGFLINVYVSLVGENTLLWLALVLILVVPMVMASWDGRMDK